MEGFLSVVFIPFNANSQSDQYAHIAFYPFSFVELKIRIQLAGSVTLGRNFHHSLCGTTRKVCASRSRLDRRVELLCKCC